MKPTFGKRQTSCFPVSSLYANYPLAVASYITVKTSTHLTLCKKANKCISQMTDPLFSALLTVMQKLFCGNFLFPHWNQFAKINLRCTSCFFAYCWGTVMLFICYLKPQQLDFLLTYNWTTSSSLCLRQSLSSVINSFCCQSFTGDAVRDFRRTLKGQVLA